MMLEEAARILKERSEQYGSADECFDRISKLASIILNKEITKYDVAMIHVATKLGRLQETRWLDDNYIDGVNYLAFAAQFINARGKNSKPDNATEDDGVIEMARKLAPTPRREEKPREKNSTPSTFASDGIYAGVQS